MLPKPDLQHELKNDMKLRSAKSASLQRTNQTKVLNWTTFEVKQWYLSKFAFYRLTENVSGGGCGLAWSRLGDSGSFLDRQINWEDFEQWYSNTHKVPYKVSYVVNLCKEYLYVLENPSRASQLLALNKDKRRLVMSAISNLSKYLSCYQYWKSIIRDNGLKWEKRSALEAIIDILNSNIEDTRKWLMKTVEVLPRRYATVLVFTALTGLRPTEACNSCKLIVEFEEKNQLHEYLNTELMMLQHFRYKDIFLRKSKNAYIGFVSKELLDLVLETKPIIRYTALTSAIRKKGLRIRIKELRKLYATLLRENEHLPKEAIDVLEGRVSESIFLRFYYKPFLQNFKEKALKGIEPSEQKLLEILS